MPIAKEEQEIKRCYLKGFTVATTSKETGIRLDTVGHYFSLFKNESILNNTGKHIVSNDIYQRINEAYSREEAIFLLIADEHKNGKTKYSSATLDRLTREFSGFCAY